MNEELRALLERIITIEKDILSRLSKLERNEILSQAKVKNDEPDHPYAGMPWVDTS